MVPSGCLKDGVWYPARMEIVDTRANRNIAVAKESMPAPVAGFSDAQRQYLGEVATIVGRSASWNPIALNEAIETQRDRMGLSMQDAIAALHLTIFGKPAGLQIAWYLAKARHDSCCRA